MKLRILEIGRVARTKGGPNRERLQQGYEKLLSSVGRVVGQAKRFSGEIAQGVKRSANVMQQAALDGLRQELDTIVPRVQQVIRQAKQRVFGGDTHVPEKLVSIFEPTTEIIRKGKASKPTEFGKMVKIQEGENQFITDYVVYPKSGPAIPIWWSPPLKHTRNGWGAFRAWWPVTLHFTQPRMRPQRMKKVSNGYAYRVGPQRALSASASRGSAGSKKDRNGGLAVRVASVS